MYTWSHNNSLIRHLYKSLLNFVKINKTLYGRIVIKDY